LASYEPESYDIAILVIRMPEMSGFDLYKELKKIDANCKICSLTAFEHLLKKYAYL